MLGGLQNPATMQAKEEAEQALLAKIKADPKLAPYASAYQTIADVQVKRAAMLGKNIALNSQLLELATTLVEMIDEDQKPSGERFPEFSDANRESLLQQLYSEAPIYTDLEQYLLADSLSQMLEMRGAEDPLCQQIMAGKGPAERAAELIAGTRLLDVAARKAVADEGREGIESSNDTMIKLAMLLDEDARAFRKTNDELAEVERQAYAKIAEALFATQGTSTYPDATFTLRLAFGTVKGYEQGGETLPAWTKMAEVFDHESRHVGQDDFVLPPSWRDAREKINTETPFNFVCTADIIGGNSGSPVVNRKGELVGLIFDGNIQSLTADYMYTDQQSRATSVHSSAIRDSLKYIYNADRIVDELGK
jgi:hypothetical protein